MRFTNTLAGIGSKEKLVYNFCLVAHHFFELKQYILFSIGLEKSSLQTVFKQNSKIFKN